MADAKSLSIGDYPALKGYPEKKVRADGTPYTVYVQPFHVDLLQPDGSVKQRQLRKVQSDPFDPSKGSKAIAAAKQATLRAMKRIEEAKSAILAHRAENAVDRKPTTLREVAKEMHDTTVRFDASGKPRGLKVGSTTKYAKHMANLGKASFDPPLADVLLQQITVGDARRHFKAYTATHGVSGSSKYRGYLMQIGGYAERCGYWSKNLFRELPVIKVPEPDAEDNLALTLIDIRKLNRQARKTGNPRLPAYMRLLRLGLRASEILALTEDDIDQEDRFITVRYSLVQSQPDWAKAQGREAVAYLEETKTRESRRKIKVHASFMTDIVASLKLAKSCELPAYDDRGVTKARRFVVPNKQGRVWLYNNALRMVRAEVFLKAGIDLREYEGTADESKANARWNHIWRNTYAADLVALDADDLQLAHLLRHTDANLSKKVYASARLDKRDAYRRFAEKIRAIHDFNWQIGEIDDDVDTNSRSPFTMRQVTLRDVMPKQPDDIDEFF